MARVIGEAAIRLITDRKGLAESIRREFRSAIRDAAGGGSLFDDIDRDSDATARRVGSRWSSVLNGLRGALGGLLSGVAGIGRLLLIGTAAAGAVAGVVSLTVAVASLGSALITASGVLGLLPAALAGFLAIKGALALGMTGISEGFKAMSEDAATFNETIKDLAPNAQKFLRAVRDQKKAFDQLRLDVQNRLFHGLTDVVQPLAEQYLPLANRLFVSIAGSINNAAREAAAFALEGETVGQVGLLVDDLRESVNNLAGAFTPAISALLDITQIGATFLPGLTQSLEEAATRFATFIREAAADGRLEEFFQRAIDTVKQLGRIASNVFEGLGNVMDAANAQGAGLLETIESITASFAEWTGSASGQDALQSFFESIKRVVDALGPAFFTLIEVIGRDFIPILADIAEIMGPVLKPIFEAFGRLLQALRPLIQAFANAFAIALKGMIPFFDALAKAIDEHMSILGPMIEEIGLAFADFFEAMVPLAPLFVQLLEAILPIIPPLLQMATELLPKLFPLFDQMIILIAEIVDLFVILAPAITDAAAVVLDIIIPVLEGFIFVIGRIVDGFGIMITGITEGTAQISGVFQAGWAAITGFFTDGAEGMKAAMGGGVDDMLAKVQQWGADVIKWAQNTMTSFANWVKKGVDDALKWVGDFVSGIGRWFSDAGTWLVDAGRNIINGLLNGLRSAAGKVLAFFTNMISEALSNVYEALGMNSPSKVFEDIGLNIGLGLVRGLKAITPKVADAATAMAGVTIPDNPLAVGTVAGAARGVAGDGYTVVNQTNVMRPGTDVKQFSDLVLGRGMGDFLSGASTLTVARNGVQAGVNDQWVGV